jgi:arylsulfatase A-like enzyme
VLRAVPPRLSRWLLQPPVLGALYVVGLALWATKDSTFDEHQAGAQARQIDALVRGPFGREVTRMGVAITATAIVLGALLGWFAAALITLRETLGPPLARSARSLAHRSFLIVALVAAGHGGLQLWAMANAPQLYASSWYARGGWRREAQLLATDILGPNGVIYAGLAVCVVFIAGSPLRWRLWPQRAARAVEFVHLTIVPRAPWQARRVAAFCAAATCALTLFAFAVSATPPASARAEPRAAGSPDANDSRPNILVIAADSLRADRLNMRTAPHLSSLASHGTRFDRAYVSLPRTFPSWVTLLTGRHPHHHGIRSMFPRWEERTRDFDALPERLARSGWATGVVSDYAGDVFSRIELGFGAVDTPQFDFRQLVRERAVEAETPLLPVLDSRLGRAAFPVVREINSASDPQLLAGDAVRAMRTLESRGPFFLVVFFSTAHFPYAAPWPYYRRFTDAAYKGRYKYDKPVGLGQEAPADARDERQVQALYDGAVSAIDEAAQSILDALTNDGLAKRTIVVVTADHGETLFDHGHGQGHGDHLFGDEGIHVPFVVVDPRQQSPAHVDTIARDVDLAPTLYALAGVPPPGDLDGRSLEPALSGKPLPPVRAYAETELWFTEQIPGLPSDLRLPYPGIARLTEVDTRHGDEVVLKREMRALTTVARHRMVRDDRWKLLYIPTRTGVRWLLFDTRDDPGETRDVAGAHPDVVARLQSDLWAWMQRDKEMIYRGGYLVPRDSGASPVPDADLGLVRLDDDAQADPRRGAQRSR